MIADGNWAGYTSFTTCTAICGGGGVRVRARVCQYAGRYGKQVCTRPGEATTDYKSCNLQDCTGRQHSDILPWTKKRTILLMHKIRILWYRGIKVLDSAAKPRANATCDCRDFTHRCIAAKSDCRFFDITWCITRMVLFFVQGSSLILISSSWKLESLVKVHIRALCGLYNHGKNGKPTTFSARF